MLISTLTDFLDNSNIIYVAILSVQKMANSALSQVAKIVIDCDPGTDDAIAILMALAHREIVEVVAITTVFGNSSLENTSRNALRLLKFCDRMDVSLNA